MRSRGLIVPSEIKLYDGNGFGSGAVCIRRFANVINNMGSAIEYVDDATYGAYFKINTFGRYSINYNEMFTESGRICGISLNSNQLATNIESITNSHVLAMQYMTSALQAHCGWSGWLGVGSIIRAHCRPGTDYTGQNSTLFSIVKMD